MPDASTLAAVAIGLVTLPVVLALASAFLPAAPTRPTRSVALLVLGDLGSVQSRALSLSLSFSLKITLEQVALTQLALARLSKYGPLSSRRARAVPPQPAAVGARA